MRSVVVVLPASMWAAIPIFRVFSIAYCRVGEFTGLGFAEFPFSITASIESPVVRIKTPRECYGHRGARYLFTITSGNVQMLCWPGPSYALRRVSEWHYPGLDRLQVFQPQELP